MAALVGEVGLAQDDRIVVPVEGEPFVGDLIEVDEDWGLKFETDTGPRSLPAADLVRWGVPAELGDDSLIVLAGGGVLVGEVRAIESERLMVDSLLFGELRLPLSRLRGVVFRPPTSRLERDRLLDQVAQSTGARDQLILENGDVVEGLLTGGGRPAVQGPLAPHDMAELKALRMQLDAGATEIPITRITAVIFNPSLVEVPPARGLRAWVGLEQDGLLVVERIASQNGLTTLTLPGGVRLTTDDEGFRESVQFLQPLEGNVVYLSDLSPLGYRHIPYLTREWGYGQDRNVLGGRLRAGGRVYLKGLGMHSTSRLAFRLDGKRKRFEAALALDDAAGRRGSVVYRVYGADAAGQWQPLYESPIIRGGDPPLPISVELNGSRGLALIVEYADRGDILDHANWLDARLE